MTAKEIIDAASGNFIAWGVVTLAGGVLYLIRRVFTNQKQIELMERSLKARDEMRERDRQDLQELKGDVKELGRYVRNAFSSGAGDD